MVKYFEKNLSLQPAVGKENYIDVVLFVFFCLFFIMLLQHREQKAVETI